TEQELAVVMSVLSSLPAVQPEQTNPPSNWSNRAGMMRRPIHPGPGAWRASTLPHPQ
ncbi:MAG: acyl-CoA carboxylase subunit epsilon, partial [Actinomycetales bacterium]|nr:acyl-CoA carboxylase subunit epsilon [Actinomycetales bacterium]